MSCIKGHVEYKKFKKGKQLTRKEALLANCFACNGSNEGGVDCLGDSCPLYQWMPYNPKRNKAERSDKQREADRKRAERLRQKAF